jgi:hypothetical protein
MVAAVRAFRPGVGARTPAAVIDPVTILPIDAPPRPCLLAVLVPQLAAWIRYERAWRRPASATAGRVTGRRSGQPRAVFLGLLRVGDRTYLGHPDVSCAWTRNLDAAGGGEIEHRDGRREPFRATLLEPGPERDAAVRASFTQHPFPGGPLYWLFRGNVRAVGRFYRLSPPGRFE